MSKEIQGLPWPVDPAPTREGTAPADDITQDQALELQAVLQALTAGGPALVQSARDLVTAYAVCSAKLDAAREGMYRARRGRSVEEHQRAAKDTALRHAMEAALARCERFVPLAAKARQMEEARRAEGPAPAALPFPSFLGGLVFSGVLAVGGGIAADGAGLFFALVGAFLAFATGSLSARASRGAPKKRGERDQD